MEPEANTQRKLKPGMPDQSTLILALTGLAVVVVVALPMVTRRQTQNSAVDDARTAYLTLMAQMESQGNPALAAVPVDSSGPGPAAGRLERDLFAPAPHRAPAAVASSEAGASGSKGPAAALAKRRMLKLGGIFIDGDQARAIIDGQVVRVGEWVKEFQVIEIQTDAVLLKRGDQVEKLALGGGR